MLFRLLFGLFVILAILMLVQSIQIVVYHFDKLNEFGFGVLVGKISLFLLSVFACFKLRKKAFKLRS